jgi:twitching motility protein PilT
MNLDELLKKTVDEGGSDLHLVVGSQPVIRKNGKLVRLGENKILPADTEVFVKELLSDKQLSEYKEKGQVDFSFSKHGYGRFRVNCFKQRGSNSIAARLVTQEVPTLEQLKHPRILSDLAKKTRGLILVTGPTGSGKSTTLAAMINQINQERDCHILTLEDPIEYLHKHSKSIINQREIGNDAESYSLALKAALREDPDVILVGEMRDIETISIAVTAAETGHLVMSTLHTTGAASTIDRVIDVFSPHQQQQIRVQLSTILQGIVSQQLIKRVDKNGRVAVLEIMTGTLAVRNLIREGKTHQLNSLIQTGAKFGMQSMDSSLANLYKNGIIKHEDAVTYAQDPDNIKRLLGSGMGIGMI